MSPKSDAVKSIIDSWSEPYHRIGTTMYEAYREEFNSLPCSKSHHNAYPGGLRDHTLNVIRCVRMLYPAYQQLTLMVGETIAFTQERAEFVAFLHDFGKIEEGKEKPFVSHYILIFRMLRGHQNLKVDDEIENALYHHHGGYGPSGEMNALAVFIHSCDLWASQVLEKEEEEEYE